MLASEVWFGFWDVKRLEVEARKCSRVFSIPYGQVSLCSEVDFDNRISQNDTPSSA